MTRVDTTRAPAYIGGEAWHSDQVSANSTGPATAAPLTDCEGEQAMNLRPLADRVLVRRIDEEEKTAGGIIIPDTAKEKPIQGEVVAVGPGGRRDDGTLVSLDVSKGDQILYGKWSGTEVTIDDEELLVMKESDIMGVIE